MGLERELESFLTYNFKVNDLKPPLFYNFPVGIRFEIGVGSTKRSYEKTGLFRASEIFNDLFNENDELIVVIDAYEGENIKRAASPIKYYKDTIYYEITHKYDDCEVTCRRHLYKINLPDIKIRKLLWKIIRGLSADIYIINLDRDIIYFLYDDRGLDIIAKRPDSIKPIYNKHNEWILDYDRKKIDSLFYDNGVFDDDKD